MELYAWAGVTLWSGSSLRRAPFAVAWDPRDPEGRYTEAVIRGVCKAGADAWVLGRAPTPAVPIFVVQAGAGGGFMVTASHNPKDQNGIKTFCPFRGMKLLPDNDRQLSRLILKTNFETLRNLPETGARIDRSEEARECFFRFSLDPENSWIEDPAGLGNLILVVDPAHGSLAGIAAEVFRRAGFGRVIEVNASTGGNVNQNSGVADLEGHRLITPAMAGPHGPFHRHEAVRTLFELGAKNRDAVRAGKSRVSGAVFDADGDRFYRLEYDALSGGIRILSGDETASLQARYRMARHPKRYRGAAYLNTVESDLNAACAARDLGLTPVLTPVGDKWILLRTIFLDLQNRARRARRALTGKIPASLEQAFSGGAPPKDRPVLDVFELEKREKALTRAIQRAGLALDEDSSFFAVGSEETGHNITPGKLIRSDGTPATVYCGNGLKSALNTFVASQFLLGQAEGQSYFTKLAQPFPPGFKKTYYVYYVRKELFFRDSAVWRQVRKTLGVAARRRGLALKARRFPEDPDMLYLSVGRLKKDEGALFVRNSGTENKIGINLRGDTRDAAALRSLAEPVIRLLLSILKDTANHFYRLELDLLSQVAAGPVPENRLVLDPHGGPRVLAEMVRQGLIESAPQGYRLTTLGTWYIKSSCKS